MTAPSMSIIVPAYNLARFLPAALDSALAQDWPADQVEVIVVDDGSTDETPQVLAGYADRVTVVRQENGGLSAAVDTGLGSATGTYIGLLDADDEWPEDRVRRHIEFLEQHPSVGLAHGDMELIDEHGNVTDGSFFRAYNKDVREGRVLGHLLAGNFVSGGASTFRASLLPIVHPISPDAAYPDWWIAANIAAVAEIATVPGCANRYRYHGANMGLGTGDAGLEKALECEIPWRRWMFKHLAADPSVTVQELRAAIDSMFYGLHRVAQSTQRCSLDLARVTPQDRISAVALVDEAGAAGAAGHHADAVRLLCRALGSDPFCGAARFDVAMALDRAAGVAATSPANLLTEPDARTRVAIAWAPTLIENTGPLEQYAAGTGAAPDATLLVLLERQEDIGPLAETVERLSLGGVDLLAMADPCSTPARKLLRDRADLGWVGGQPESWADAA